MKRIFAVFLVLFVPAFAHVGGSAAAAKIAAGRAALATHDLVAAQADFGDAISLAGTEEDASAYQTASALLGFTRVFALAAAANTSSAAGTATSQFLDGLNIGPSAGRDVYNWAAQLPHDGNGNLILPAGYNLTTVESLWLNVLLPATAAARGNLSGVTSQGFLLTLYPSETTSPATLNIDYGDVLMARASLSAVEFVFHFLSGQDLHANLDAMNQLAQGNMLKLQQVLAANPDFLKVGSTSERAAALASLSNVISLYRQASTFIRTVRPAGVSRMFMLDAKDLPAEAEFRAQLDKIELSFTEPVSSDKGNAAFFTGPLFGSSWVMRDRIPALNAVTGGFDLESIVDASLGGIAAGLTREQVAGLFDRPELGWTWVTPLPQGGALYRYLALPGGKHVASGDAGMVLTSNDGTTWVTHSIAHEGQIWGLATNGTAVVACTDQGSIYLSNDSGVTWQKTLATGSAFWAVTYGGGTFVAVGNNGNTATSSDGQHWTVNSSPTGGNSFYDVLYTGSVYLAVGQLQGTAVIASSNDGVTWNTNFTASSSGYSFLGVAQGGGKFVAVGDANHEAVSTNGTAWTAGTLLASGTTTFSGVGYFNGKFVAAGNAGTIANSSDGGSGAWTSGNSGDSADTLNTVGVGSTAVYVATQAGLILQSTDGSTFTRALDPQTVGPLGTGALLSIRALGSELYAVGGSSTLGTIVHSSDGLTFTPVAASGATSTLWGILQHGATYYAVGNGGALVTTTTPSGTWTPAAASPLGGGANLRSISYLNNSLYVITGNNATLLTSGDGATWTSRTTLVSHTGSDFLYGAAYGNGVYVAVGGNNNNLNYVFTSTDGSNWTQRSLGIGNTFRAVVFYQGYFTAVGNLGAVYRSANGVNWSFVDAGTEADFGGLSVRDGRYYAAAGASGSGFGSSFPVGPQAVMLVSSDGVHWAQTDRGAANNAYSVELFNGRLYTSGDNFSIQRSEVIAASSVHAPVPVTPAPASSVNQGTNHVLAVTSDTSGGQTFVWTKNESVIPGVTGPALALKNVQFGDGGTYQVTVTNAAGTSSAASFNFSVSESSASPAITQQPESQTVSTGFNATFSVAASGTGSFTYQWQKDGVSVSDGTHASAATVAGATTDTLMLTGVQGADAGAYTVVVTGTGTPATSDQADLTVDSNPAYTFSTLAGLAFTSGNTTNVSGSSARFNAPCGVAVDSANNVYVADTNNGAIRKITPAGAVTTLASGTFGSPVGIVAVGSTLYFTTGGHAVRSIGTDGTGLTLLAGTVGSPGSADGAGLTVARFNNPRGIASDGTYLYVADTSNHTIRKIEIATGIVSTLAGSAGSSGFTNANGSAARFNGPQGVALSPGGANLFVADSNNNVVRKIVVSSGAVTTFAGQGGTFGFGEVDGPGTLAAFAFPVGIAVDAAGYVYVGDNGGAALRRIAPDGSYVHTIGGQAFWQGGNDGIGTDARFNTPGSIVLDAAANLYIADTNSHTIRKGVPSAAISWPVIGVLPVDQTVAVGGAAALKVSATGAGTLSYQWKKNGVAIGGATNAALTFTSVQAADAGNYTVTVTSTAGGLAVSPIATLTVNPGPAITGLSGLPTIAVGATLNLGVSALGAPALGYQWLKDGLPLTDGLAISGSTTSQLTVTNAQTSDSGRYSVEVFNSYAGEISSPVTVVVYASEPYSFSTFAGRSAIGTADGTGSAARFNLPSGVARDSAGNLYVADTNGQTIRKIASGGVVTTFAGMAAAQGSADGSLAVARFKSPQSVAIDGNGDLYVADGGNGTIRKITMSTGTVSTLAGVAGSFGSADGALVSGVSTARFAFPQAITIDGTGNVYVADSSNRTIRKISPTGDVTTLAGSAGLSGSVDATGGAARFSSPVGVAVDGAGNVYVADNGNRTIRKVTAGGVVTTMAGQVGVSGSTNGSAGLPLTAQFTSPVGIALKPDGVGGSVLYVTDNQTIRTIATSDASAISAGGALTVGTLAGANGALGNLDAATGPATTARFNSPVGLVADSSGNLFVADSKNDTIRSVTAAGLVTTVAGSPIAFGANDSPDALFNFPKSVAPDLFGNVYVADSSNNTIRKIAANGTVTTVAGTPGISGSTDTAQGSPLFNNPTGVATDAAGNVYVTDRGNRTIRKITFAAGPPPTVTVTTLAGLAGSGNISIDGTAGSGGTARFSAPNGIAVNALGTIIYVADQGAHTIREIASGGVVTLAGFAFSAGNADGRGSGARFNAPADVAVDSHGNVYVADNSNGTLRKITPGGDVTTVFSFGGFPNGVGVDAGDNVYVAGTNSVVFKITPAGTVTAIGGLYLNPGNVDGIGSAARFTGGFGVKVDGTGKVFVADGNANTIRKGFAFALPAITDPPATFASGAVGDSVTLSVAATGTAPLTYQWRKFGQPIAGATTATLQLNNLSAFDAGLYDVVVSNGSTPASAVTRVTVNPAQNLPAALTASAGFAPLVERGNGDVVWTLRANDGKIYVSGDFSSMAGAPRDGFGRLNADGTLDAAFVPARPDALVWAMGAQSTNKVVIGGDFESVGGIGRRFLARLNADGSLDASFTPTFAFPGSVYALVIQPDDKIVAAGVRDGSNVNIVRLNGDGTVDSSFNVGTGFDNDVYDMRRQADGKLVAIGPFTSYNGTSVGHIARLNANGSLDITFNNGGSGFDGSPNVIQLQPGDGKIVIGGYFTSYDGTARNHLVRLDGTTGALDAGFVPAASASSNVGGVWQFDIQTDGAIVIAGESQLGGEVVGGGIHRLTSTGTVDAGFNPGTGFGGGADDVVVLSNGQILANPDSKSGSYNSVAIGALVRINSDGTLDATYDSGVRIPGTVNTIVPAPNGAWIVGGDFDHVNGVARNDLARLNADGSLDLTFMNTGTGFNGAVNAVVMQADGKVIAGGAFTCFNGPSAHRIVRLDTAGARDSSFGIGSGFNDDVRSLALQADGDVLVGGRFSSYGDNFQQLLARLGPDGTLDGAFVANGDAAGWNDGDKIDTLMVLPNGDIYAGGRFRAYRSGNVTDSGLIRLHRDGTRDDGVAVGGGFDGEVLSLALQSDGKLVVGGSLSEFYDVENDDFVFTGDVARLNPDLTLDGGFAATDFYDGNVASVVLQPDGKIVAAGSFEGYGSPSLAIDVASVARLNINGTIDPTFRVPGLASPVTTMQFGDAGTLLIGGGRFDFPNRATAGLALLEAPPDLSITNTAADVTLAVGGSATLSFTGTVSPVPTFQWLRNGIAVAGATNPSLAITNVTSANSGVYSVAITNAGGTFLSPGTQVDVLARSLLNLSSNTTVPAGGSIGASFTIEGGTPKQILIRGLGPVLGGAPFNFSGVLTDPRLTLFDPAGVQIATNDDWGSSPSAVATAFAAVGALPLPDASKDAALLVTLSPGTYTARLDAVDGSGGRALLEVYDVDTGDLPRIVMLTMRGPVTGETPLVVGFNLTGAPGVARSYLLRAMGPSLGFSAGVLSDPVMAVYDSKNVDLGFNDDWGSPTAEDWRHEEVSVAQPPVSGSDISAVVANVGAQPSNHSYDSALFLKLAPGTYTAQIEPYSPGYESGEVVFELFAADNQRPATISPAITYLARNQTVSLGDTAYLGVNTVAKPAATFQWRKYVNGAPVAINGATGPVLALGSIQASDITSYDVVISNSVATITSPQRALILLSSYHSADIDKDSRIDLVELTRVIQLYKYATGAVRTGEYHTQTVPATEDGFAPGPGAITTYHSADSNHDGRIDSAELSRVIQLYDYSNGSARTGQYHSQSGTEDGFAPGPNQTD